MQPAFDSTNAVHAALWKSYILVWRQCRLHIQQRQLSREPLSSVGRRFRCDCLSPGLCSAASTSLVVCVPLQDLQVYPWHKDLFRVWSLWKEHYIFVKLTMSRAEGKLQRWRGLWKRVWGPRVFKKHGCGPESDLDFCSKIAPETPVRA